MLTPPLVDSQGPLPLDEVQSIVLAAYSYRRQMFSGYSGALWVAQRTSDSATTDAPVVDGQLDEAALLTWVLAAGNAYGVATAVYDQSGNANNATLVGTNVRVRGDTGLLGGFSCDGTNYFQVPSGLYTGKSAGAVIMLMNAGRNVGAVLISPDGTSTFTPYGDALAYENFLSTTRPGIAGYGDIAAATRRLHASVQTGSALRVYKNGVARGTAAATFSATLTNRKFPSGTAIIEEVIFLSRQPSPAELDYIVADMLWGNGVESLLPAVHPYYGAAPTTLGTNDAIQALFAANEVGAWFDPGDISTLFQDNDGSTPVTAAGQTVALMLDKSGNGKHATQATASKRPTYQIAANGKGVLRFDGVDDCMATAAITAGADKGTIIAGLRRISAGAAGTIAEFSGNWNTNAGTIVLWSNAAASSYYAANSRGSASSATAQSSNYTPPDAAVLSALGNISGDRITLRRNATQVAEQTTDQGTGNYGAHSLFIGTRNGGSSLPFNGDLHGMILRFAPTAIDSAALEAAEAWMNTRTGAY